MLNLINDLWHLGFEKSYLEEPEAPTWQHMSIKLSVTQYQLKLLKEFIPPATDNLRYTLQIITFMETTIKQLPLQKLEDLQELRNTTQILINLVFKRESSFTVTLKRLISPKWQICQTKTWSLHLLIRKTTHPNWALKIRNLSTKSWKFGTLTANVKFRKEKCSTQQQNSIREITTFSRTLKWPK